MTFTWFLFFLVFYSQFTDGITPAQYTTLSSGKMDDRTQQTQTVVIAVADGSEDVETFVPVDVLRRAGVEVTVASVYAKNAGYVELANKSKVIPDANIEDVKDKKFDVILLPGGLTGANHLKDSKVLEEMLKSQVADQRLIAAICASPKLVLEEHGILGTRTATGYPGKEPKNFEEGNVVVSQKIITSRGPGTAMEFALVVVEQLLGEAERIELEKQLLFKRA